MNPFRNILRLSVGDLIAKGLQFATFIYLARILGVTNYGVLEFAFSTLAYFALFADGGLDLFGTREAARGEGLPVLIARIVPLRLLTAGVSLGALLVLSPLFPDYPVLRTLLVLLGLTFFLQAFNLKWVFMGREQMNYVAVGLVIAQLIFAGGVVASVRQQEGVVWVPLIRFMGDLAAVVYFGFLYRSKFGSVKFVFRLEAPRKYLAPALVMAASSSLALMSFNFDTVLLGFLAGPNEVGWYSAAYKPVTAALIIPVTYFMGLFPTLSRTYVQGGQDFGLIVTRSLRLTAIAAVLLAVGGTFLAGPLLLFLYGNEYSPSIPAAQILVWSASLVILRGTFRQSLNASGKQRMDLICALTAALVNAGMNLYLIPRFGIVGAAAATVVSEIIWITMASYFFYRHVSPVIILPHLLQPAIAGLATAIFLLITPQVIWPLRAALSVMVYLGALFLLGEVEVRSWVKSLRWI